jgi:DNA-binding beta-propeller fold protein YncE
MRRRTIEITALCGFVCAVAVACGGGGGGDSTSIISRNTFAQGFFPLLLQGSLADPCQSPVVRTSGDVAVRNEGDLFAVAQNADVYAVSRTDGSCRVFASTPSGTRLLSITIGSGDDTRLFAGDDVGRIWVIPAAGGAVTTPLIDTGSDPITGLAVAPDGYGDVEGSLLAAAGTTGIVRVVVSDVPAFSTFAPPLAGGSISDLAFSGDTLFAVDRNRGEIDEIEVTDTTGTATAFVENGLTTPVGITVDTDVDEIYVADAGDDILKTVPIAGGTPTRRARYDFDTFAGNGLAYDGIGALAFVTSGPLAIRVANVPRINPADADFNQIFAGPTSGYGDLELDRNGEFVLVATDEDDLADPDDTVSNFLSLVPRDASEVETLESSIGTPPEHLFAVAIDPVDEMIYFSGFAANASVRSGNIYQHGDEEEDTVSLLVSLTTDDRVLALELAPATFGGFGGQLVASTEDGRLFVIDPASPSTPVEIALSESVTHLVDLVFASTGELYAVENDGSDDLADSSRILRISATGTVTQIAPSSALLGAADGIEIDEGGDRLLLATQNSGGFQIIEASLGAIPATLASLGGQTSTPPVEIDDGFFPTGIVYDRLGTVVYRRGNTSTQLGAISVQP